MVGAKPDDRVQDHAWPIVDMQQLVTGLLARATHPVAAPFGQVVEPGKAEVAQVEEQQAVPRQVFHQRERLAFAVAQGVGDVLDAQPALRAEVKEGSQFSREQRWVAEAMLASHWPV